MAWVLRVLLLFGWACWAAWLLFVGRYYKVAKISSIVISGGTGTSVPAVGPGVPILLRGPAGPSSVGASVAKERKSGRERAIGPGLRVVLQSRGRYCAAAAYIDRLGFSRRVD